MRTPSNLLVLGLTAALAVKAEAAGSTGKIPALEDAGVRAQLSKWIQGLTAPTGGHFAYVLEGEGEGGLVPNAGAGEAHKVEAARQLIEVLLEGTRSLTHALSKGGRDPNEEPHLYQNFLLPLALDAPEPIHRYDTTIERYIPAITGEDSFKTCELGRPEWPEQMPTDPTKFMYLMCTKDGSFTNWLVFADFPKGSKERYFLGGADELPSEFDVDKIKDYWFVMAGFSAPNEALTLGLSYTEDQKGLGLTTVYGRSQFSDSAQRMGSSYTFPYNPEDLHDELSRMSRRMPAPSTEVREAAPAFGATGRVNPSGL